MFQSSGGGRARDLLQEVGQCSRQVFLVPLGSFSVKGLSVFGESMERFLYPTRIKGFACKLRLLAVGKVATSSE